MEGVHTVPKVNGLKEIMSFKEKKLQADPKLYTCIICQEKKDIFSMTNPVRCPAKDACSHFHNVCHICVMNLVTHAVALVPLEKHIDWKETS